MRCLVADFGVLVNARVDLDFVETLGGNVCEIPAVFYPRGTSESSFLYISFCCFPGDTIEMKYRFDDLELACHSIS